MSLKWALLRFVVGFVNGARMVVEKFLHSCSRKEVVLAEGDRQVGFVNHYFWDPKERKFCISTFKLDPVKGHRHYKRCVRY